MGETEIVRSKNAIKRTILIGCSLLSLNASGLLTNFAAYAQGSDTQTLATLEQKFFFKTYGEENNEARLLRIEKRVFGDQMTGSFQERLARVVSAASPQANPDGSVAGAAEAPQQSAPVDPKKEEAERRQAEVERAKIAMMAAREQSVSKAIDEGVSFWRAKQSTSALQKFEQALQMDPHNATAHYYMGIVHESRNDYVTALGDYRKASNEDPGNKEYADAVVAVQKLMNSKPAVSPQQQEINKLAEAAANAYKRGEVLSAMDLYRQLDAKSPNQATVKYNLGSLYLNAKDPQTALEYYRQAVALKPNDPKFTQAYRQLKENVDKAEAIDKQTEAAWAANGYPGGGAPPNGASGAGGFQPQGNGIQSGQQGPQWQQGQQSSHPSGQGMPPNGMAPNGMPPNGMAPNGMASNDMEQNSVYGNGMQSQNGSTGGSSSKQHPSHPALNKKNHGGNQNKQNSQNNENSPNNPSSQNNPNFQNGQAYSSGGMTQNNQGYQNSAGQGYPNNYNKQNNQAQYQGAQNYQNPQANQGYQGNNFQNSQSNFSGNQSAGSQSQMNQMASSSAPPGTYLPHFVPTMPGTGKSPGVHTNDGRNNGQSMMNNNASSNNNGSFNNGSNNHGSFNSNAPQNGNGQSDTFSGQDYQRPQNLPTPPAQGNNQQRSTGPANTKLSSKSSPFGLPKPQTEPNALESLGIIATSTASGVLITHIGVGSRASKAGLVKGDYIRALDGKVVNSVSQMLNLLKNKAPDAPVSMHVQRKDQLGTVNL